jgi:group II intron reverse transcriptase/maturase
LVTCLEGAGRIGKAKADKSMMDDQRKSDDLVVPTKSPNKAGRPAAEAVEGRRSAARNTFRGAASPTQGGTGAPDGLERVRRAARKDRKAKLTSLFHHLTVERLRAAFLATKKNAAAGVDGVTWKQYAEHSEENLAVLHGKLHRGAFRAKPSRRSYIPKADGRERPLGIATLEDKVVQRAVVEVLNAVYEVDFLGFSYGFRPKRSQHDALDALSVGIRRKKINWVLDADIRGFFDNLSHEWLVKFIEHRIGDPRIVKLIHKWLGAGVLEDGQWSATEEGTPQGASISPLLANVYLHYVFDLWAHQWRRRHAKGDVIVVRYADDFVVGFQFEHEALEFKQALETRLREFSLELNAEKTRLIRFGAFAAEQRVKLGQRRPETFDFLGFTHICGRSRSGKFLIVRRSMSRRMHAKLKAIGQELRHRRHLSVSEQGKWLARVVEGYFGYHAVPTNGPRMLQFRRNVERRWFCALRRRSQRRSISGVRMKRLAAIWIPRVRLRHPWPEERFDARTRGRSPVR